MECLQRRIILENLIVRRVLEDIIFHRTTLTLDGMANFLGGRGSSALWQSLGVLGVVASLQVNKLSFGYYFIGVGCLASHLPKINRDRHR